jgi:hypothetical protein
MDRKEDLKREEERMSLSSSLLAPGRLEQLG